MNDRPALLILGHGSRDIDGVEEFRELVKLVRAGAPELTVGAGFIELAEPSVDDAVDQLVADGATDIVLVPMVLLAAGHLKNDGPAALARARIRHPGVRLRLARDPGVHPAMLAVAEERIRAAADDVDPAGLGVALIGRGSSDPDACADLWKIGRLLSDNRGLGSIEPGFVGVATPRVPEAMERCRLLGATTVVVSPLFLFSGLLLHRIRQQAGDWAGNHPEVDVRLAAHLGPDPRWVPVLLERYREATGGDVRMNCDLCVYRVQLPGYEAKVGQPISLTPHGDGPARGSRRVRRAIRVPTPAPSAALKEPAPVRRGRFIGQTAEREDAPAVEVRDLTFSYPDGRQALSGVGLTVHRRERVALLGPNGAGKTSLVLQLNGVLRPDNGTIHVGGLELTPKTVQEIRRRVGLVFQDPDDQLFTPTIGRDVAYGPAHLGLTGAALAERVTEALSYVGLADAADRPPNRLSVGERRRAAVATVLAMHPEVLVLDEPTSNLDPAGRREFVDLVKQLGMTTLVVTHDLPFALELCPRSIVLNHGQIVGDGPTRELLADRGFMSANRLELPAGFNPLGG
ncbi:CbiX/SirB N-terminal domain-containing protein [Amycolatopsis sp. MtRt-6]|uniref:CbiX/SirB N-terminal domain-containing protein n=1 Tax=Amycolatopsis sp. MtRt-6 TaxID=2792782 RepID=UPI001A8DA8D2|nr:CbiX/SirB N-terminal domain-containing protein [Amycolatopsis sp. MtRt-6]